MNNIFNLIPVHTPQSIDRYTKYYKNKLIKNGFIFSYQLKNKDNNFVEFVYVKNDRSLFISKDRTVGARKKEFVQVSLEDLQSQQYSLFLPELIWLPTRYIEVRNTNLLGVSMNNKRLVNALTKAGFEVKSDINRGQDNYRFAVNGDYVVSWYIQDERAVCVSMNKLSHPSDSMTDYFPGSFAHTIKEAVKHLKG